MSALKIQIFNISKTCLLCFANWRWKWQWKEKS